MNVDVLPRAQLDMVRCAEFWEKQRLGLGAEFLEFIESEAESLAGTAGIHAIRRGHYRAVIQGRFPYYSMFYRIVGERVEVVAIVDTRRDPKWIDSFLRRRLK